MRAFFAVAVLVAIVAQTHGYSHGAPTDVCQDMTPKHGVDPQPLPAPYTISTNTKKAKAGVPMTVTVKGVTNKDTIRGFILQARNGNEIVGKFTVTPGDALMQTLTCGNADNSLTHKKHPESADSNTLVATWTPPAGYNGDIKFRCTVVKTGYNFWVGIESDTVAVHA